MLFHKRTKTIIKYVWAIFALLIIISMVFAYSGGGSLLGSTGQSQPIAQTVDNAATQKIINEDNTQPQEQTGTVGETQKITLPQKTETKSEMPFQINI